MFSFYFCSIEYYKYEQAVIYLGHSGAQFSDFGKMYEHGHDVTQDFVQAAEFFFKRSSIGKCPQAQFAL